MEMMNKKTIKKTINSKRKIRMRKMIIKREKTKRTRSRMSKKKETIMRSI
jgi:hypothetical protein